MNIYIAKEKQGAWLIIKILIATSVFLLICSRASSMILKTYGDDSDIFVMLGKLTKDGMVPYKEFFDHKGPFIILVEYLAFLLPNYKVGLFVIELLFIAATLMAEYNIFKLYFNENKSCIFTIVSLFVLNIYYQGGNFTEEYCLPFLMWSTFFFVKYSNRKNKKNVEHNLGYAFFYGITFTVCALTRITNALPLCAIILVLFVYVLFEKRYDIILKNILWFALGILVSITPFVIYFIAKGALKDAIYATFIFNFRYAKASTNEKYLLKEQIKTIVYLIPIFTVFLVSCFKKNKLKTKNILSICMVVMSVFAIALQISGQPYRHYLIIWLPLLCIGVCIVDLKSIKYRTYRYVLMLFLIISSCIVIGKNVSVLADSCNLVTKNEEQDYAKYVNDLKEKIPGDKLDRVIAYNVLAKFYIISDIKPCYKYCILQDWQCSHDSEMTLEFEKMIKSLKAQYIVITRDSINAYDGYINQHYHQKYENKYFELLEINYNTNYVKGR